jgi:hypothetical protein
MPIKKYEGVSEKAEFKAIVHNNMSVLCARGVGEDYIPDFSKFQIGFVSFLNGEVKGFAVGIIKNGHPYIELLCGQGHGKALTESIAEWFKKKQYNYVTLGATSKKLVKKVYQERKFVCSNGMKLNKDGLICMERELYPDDLVKNMSKLAIKPANASNSSSSSRLPSGCADLRKFSKYIKDLNDYSAADLKDFVNNCSLASGTATTKAKAIDIIKLTVRMYKSQYNL